MGTGSIWVLTCEQTGADIQPGACIVHEVFKSQLQALRKDPEAGGASEAAPEHILADVIGSTKQLIQAAQTLPQQTLIVATDQASLQNGANGTQ